MRRLTPLTVAFAAGLLGLLVLAACAARSEEENEERPPIIVRGGSLIFESDAPWFEDATDEWKQDQPQGRPTRVYDVTFEPASCTARSMPEFTVVYDPDDGGPEGERRFTVTRLPRAPGNKGSDGPAVKGAGLARNNGAPKPALTYRGTSSTILRVEGPGGQTVCERPTRVMATPKP